MVISVPRHIFENRSFHHTYQLHSVFKHTKNFVEGDRLIALHDNSRDASPMGIIMSYDQDEFESPNHVIKSVSLSKNSIYLGDMQIQKEDVRLSEHDLLALVNECGMLNDSQIKLLSRTIDDELNPRIHANSNLTQLLQERIIKMQLALKQKQDLPLTIQSLIGFGEGLTPSGDDIICGLMVGLLITGKVKLFYEVAGIVSAILRNKNATSIISHAFLKHATQGRFIENILVLYKKLIKNEPISALIQKISVMGHSSGTDYLMGVMYGISGGKDNDL
jgi:hypothetical protein